MAAGEDSEVLPEQRPFADLVQIRSDDQFGTGLLVGDGLVLTALHCVCNPSNGWKLRKSLEVHLFRSIYENRISPYKVQVVWPRLDGLGERPPDVAVLRIVADEKPRSLINHRFGELPGVPVNGSALGFPKSTAEGGARIEYNQPGRVCYTSLTRRSLTIDLVGHHKLDGSKRWAGLSGGPLLANDLIVGIMREVREEWQGEAIEAEPLAPLIRVDKDLRDILGLALPLDDPSDPFQITLLRSYEVIGIAAYAASNRILEAASSKPFYGRVTDLELLQRTITDHDRGIILLRGEAGIGKSSLAAQWRNSLATSPGVLVVRHAFSVQESATASRSAMVACLVRQVADIMGPLALGGGEPGDSDRQRDRLARLLSQDCASGECLVVILDGLDEAEEPVDLTEAGLGRGVFILATCRAGDMEEPPVLQQWRDRAVRERTLILDRMLPRLIESQIALWLSDAIGHTVVVGDMLLMRVIEVSEGIPLFLSYLIPEAIQDLAIGKHDPFPSSFRDYAQRQLLNLKTPLRGTPKPWSWGNTKKLFTLLALAQEPLPTAALRQLGFKEDLDDLDQRAERWLWRKPEGNSVSLAHPRLASVFLFALRELDRDLVDLEQEQLLEACRNAWSSATRNYLKPYALSHLPKHFVDLGRTTEAADLLGETAFILERLATVPTTATVHALASETVKLDVDLGGSHSRLADWRRFWSETEEPLAAAVENAEQLRLNAVQMLARLANDRFPSTAPLLESFGNYTSPASTEVTRLAKPLGFAYPSLLRSIESAHRDVIWGVLVLSNALVTWSRDGAIKFWTLEGDGRPGGSTTAHHGGVEGVLLLSSSVVSWGNDGAVRFWDLNGKSLGGLVAHRGGTKGVVMLRDKLASLGSDGSVSFWSCDGKELVGGGKAHGSAGRIERLPDGLLSWGSGFADTLAFWNISGELHRTVQFADSSRIVGALVLQDSVVTWESNGAIRFWGFDGELRDGGDPEAHTFGAHGMLLVADVLLSWGHDGLRLWSHSGERLSGGNFFPDHRRQDLILGAIELPKGFVTWSIGGAVCFWDFDGGLLPGGDVKAHSDRVEGMLALPDKLVSWGKDGAIRFWSIRGASLAVHAQAHVGGVSKVRALDNELVSWGADNSVRFWNYSGAFAEGSLVNAHREYIRGVHVVSKRVISWGNDNAVRIWDRSEGASTSAIVQAHRARIRGILPYPRSSNLSACAESSSGFPSVPQPISRRNLMLAAVGIRPKATALVTWGQDGALFFWNLLGEPLTGGTMIAHDHGVAGVLALEDRFVSWGGPDGRLRFWSLDGRPLHGGGAAHPGGVNGVIALPDGLVSWGRNGRIRVWSSQGLLRSGCEQSEPQYTDELSVMRSLYGNSCRGVLSVPNGLVSWHQSGSIRFWNLGRNPSNTPAIDAHDADVEGMLALPSGVASWGRDGAIHFWNFDGKQQVGGDSNAHQGAVTGMVKLSDRLASCGEDGCIHFWSLNGMQMEGGRAVHDGSIRGMLALTEQLVTWDNDGEIRISGPEITLRLGDGNRAHRGAVEGVLALPDAIISWGIDNTLRRWSRAGASIGDPWISPAPIEFVAVIQNNIWVGLLGRPHRLILGTTDQ